VPVNITNVTCPLKQLNEAKIISEHGKNIFLLTTMEQIRPHAEESFLQLMSPA
jgi:hypothetical protein